MKTTLNSIFLSFICITTFMLCIQDARAQVTSGKKYRVIAYKNGQPNVYSVSNEVIVIPPMTIYIPNTFTPNGDGLNDTFGISGESISEFNMKIFNRWGQLIFETSNVNERWDGTFLGTKVPMGTYVYNVTASMLKGGRQTKEGSVNVVL